MKYHQSPLSFSSLQTATTIDRYQFQVSWQFYLTIVEVYPTYLAGSCCHHYHLLSQKSSWYWSRKKSQYGSRWKFWSLHSVTLPSSSCSLNIELNIVQLYCSTIIEVFATYLAGLCSRPRSSLRLGEQITSSKMIIMKKAITKNNDIKHQRF